MSKLLAFIAPYRKAAAAAVVPAGLALLLELGVSGDMTLRDVLQALAIAVAGGGTVYRIPNRAS